MFYQNSIQVNEKQVWDDHILSKSSKIEQHKISDGEVQVCANDFVELNVFMLIITLIFVLILSSIAEIVIIWGFDDNWRNSISPKKIRWHDWCYLLTN